MNLVQIEQEKSFEIVDGRTGRRVCLYYNLPGTYGSGELKSAEKITAIIYMDHKIKSTTANLPTIVHPVTSDQLPVS